MNTRCPHCQTEIEIDAETRAALADQTLPHPENKCIYF